MVFQKEARVRLDQEKGVHYKVGSRIGEGQPVRADIHSDNDV